MKISKGLAEKIKTLTENGEVTKTEVAQFCKVHPSYITNSLKLNEVSDDVYKRLLVFIERTEKKVAKRKEREQRIIQPSNS